MLFNSFKKINTKQNGDKLELAQSKREHFLLRVFWESFLTFVLSQYTVY